MEVQEIIDNLLRFSAIFQVLWLRCACRAMYAFFRDEHDVKSECVSYIVRLCILLN